MSTIIVGGQYGSEGKGKLSAYLANEYGLAVKSGGPNSGHTIVFDKTYKLRCIPSAFVNSNCLLGIAPGAIINVDVLLNEIEECNINSDRLIVDRNAMIINQQNILKEEDLKKKIGSTGSGVGYAAIDRIKRLSDTKLAKDISVLSKYVGNVAGIIQQHVKDRKKILIEGSQGFGLSLFHGDYPYVTSRDTTAGTLCGELGIGPKSIDEIILVIRPYPIRVGGNSGILKYEIDWSQVTKESNYPEELIEYTTVTKKIRRIAKFDIEIVKLAASYNSATCIALNFADYIDWSNYGLTRFNELNVEARRFIDMLEKEISLPVSFIGTGPKNFQMIDRR